MNKYKVIVGVVVLAVIFPIMLLSNLLVGVHLDSQTIYGGFLGALMGIGFDRFVAGVVDSK